MERRLKPKKTPALAKLAAVFGALSFLLSFVVRMRMEIDAGSSQLIQPPDFFQGIYKSLGFLDWLWPVFCSLALLFATSSLVMIGLSRGRLKGAGTVIMAIALVVLSVLVILVFRFDVIANIF